jgi:hypothetical protein
MKDEQSPLWIALTILAAFGIVFFLRHSTRSKVADKLLVAASITVAFTTAELSHITGYGTVLFQLVVLWAWIIVAKLTSDEFADLHHSVMWPVALLLNMSVFLIVAIPVWAILRGRAPKIASTAILLWLLLYVGLLFGFFPAKDGP